MVQIVSLLCVFAVMAMSFAQQMGAPEQMGGAQLVRQCSCEEVEQCREDIKMEGLRCGDSCWQIASQITQRPEELRQCFEGKTGQIDSFVNCFQDSYRGCAANMNGPMIPRQSFEPLVQAAEKKIRKTVKTLSVPGVTDQLTDVIQTAENFGACFKRCVRRKAIGGVCIEKFNCQPLLPNEAQAKRINDQCTRGVDFKKQAGPLCNCALNAGVTDLAQYCPILALMGNQG